jgi:hypothetical protein
MRSLFFILVILSLFTACGNAPKGKEKLMEVDLALAPPPIRKEKILFNKHVNPGQTSQDVTRKIIKEGEISFETKNIAETRKSIYNSIQKLGGYIAEENETNDSTNNQDHYVLNARIPENNFDLFLNNVTQSALKIDAKSIRARDATTDYIDISTHLADKKKLEERYVELLKKGNKISDLLEIENKISQIETSIDSTQGQLNYLVNQVEFSSLNITFYTKKAGRDNSQAFGGKFISALAGGWDDAVMIFLGFVSIWPLWIIVAILYLAFKNWRKKHPQKKGEKT